MLMWLPCYVFSTRVWGPGKCFKLIMIKINLFSGLGSVLVNDFWTPPQAPPPINFVHDEISKLVFIYYYFELG